jgi:hypothetical protein
MVVASLGLPVKRYAGSAFFFFVFVTLEPGVE